jgi:flagellin-like hook-associated protein FlgL
MLNISAASAPHKNNIRVVSDTISHKMIRLSSGKRINSAADDAAGLAVSSKMIAQIMQKGMAARNIADMQSAITVAMQSAKTSQDIVQRIRELTVRAASAVISQSIVDIEIESLLAELEKVSANAALNGKLVSNGAFNENVSLGNQDGNFSINLPNFSPDELGMVDNSSSVTANYHTAANTNEINGSTFPFNVDTGSTSQTLSLNLSSIDPLFGGLSTFIGNHPNGSFKLKGIEASGIGANAGNLTINSSGDLQLSGDGSGNIQNYTAYLIYTGADTKTYTLRLELIDNNTPSGNTAFTHDGVNRRQEDISARINLEITADGSDTTIDYLTIGTGVTQNTNARAEWDDQYSHFWDLAGYRTLGVHPADPLGGIIY